jgi:hypothetical protein
MATVMPEGDEIRNAIKFISMNLEENPNQPIFKLVEKAVFKYDLSPMDSEFLMNFFKKK